jgi:hypothetical protein
MWFSGFARRVSCAKHPSLRTEKFQMRGRTCGLPTQAQQCGLEARGLELCCDSRVECGVWSVECDSCTSTGTHQASSAAVVTCHTACWCTSHARPLVVPNYDGVLSRAVLCTLRCTLHTGLLVHNYIIIIPVPTGYWFKNGCLYTSYYN